jgi:hypothetical protein
MRILDGGSPYRAKRWITNHGAAFWLVAFLGHSVSFPVNSYHARPGFELFF